MKKLSNIILLLIVLMVMAAPAFIAVGTNTVASFVTVPVNSVVLIRSISPFGQSIGSGFFVSADGGIITAAHVVDEATLIIIELVSGEKFVADVQKIYVDSDCALLDISGENHPALKLADAKLGETVRVIGAPMGRMYFPYVTKGIVCREKIPNPFPGDVSVFAVDAATNPGNSGGPVINDANECIGIILATDTRGIGLNFVLSASELLKLLE